MLTRNARLIMVSINRRRNMRARASMTAAHMQIECMVHSLIVFRCVINNQRHVDPSDIHARNYAYRQKPLGIVVLKISPKTFQKTKTHTKKLTILA